MREVDGDSGSQSGFESPHSVQPTSKTHTFPILTPLLFNNPSPIFPKPPLPCIYGPRASPLCWDEKSTVHRSQNSTHFRKKRLNPPTSTSPPKPTEKKILKPTALQTFDRQGKARPIRPLQLFWNLSHPPRTNRREFTSKRSLLLNHPFPYTHQTARTNNFLTMTTLEVDNR